MKVKIIAGVSIGSKDLEPSDEVHDLPDGVARLLISQNQAVLVEASPKGEEPTDLKSEKEPEKKEPPAPKKRATKTKKKK